MLELSVADNGPGIPQDVQTKIFDPFFTTKPPGKGTGLGLSVTRRLVQDVDGTIQVESFHGHGCCMRLRFPMFEYAIHKPDTQEIQ
jgi:signal transduction histidine kinase